MEGISLADACEVLAVSPAVLRSFLERVPESLPIVDMAGERYLPPETVIRLRNALRLRAEGAEERDIELALRGEGPSTTTETTGLPAMADQPARSASEGHASVLEALTRLTEELAKGERARAEDRDRLMMALIRTQQEIQHLRYEVAATTSRRARKRSSILPKWFGRSS